MSLSLRSLHDALASDPGLQLLPPDQLAAGLAAADELNRVLLLMIRQTGVNDDGLISPEDMQAISDAIWMPANAQPWRDFWLAHGNDSGEFETGYHLLQNDGGTLEFRGRNFADTIADSIYHFGFQVQDGHYFNEDGNTNASLIDVAGWLNFFLNGRSVVWGTDADETLGTSDYDRAFILARSETFYAGDGNDDIWAGLGADRIYGGAGNDREGGGDGNDRMMGEAGSDILWGEAGQDVLSGGRGNDTLSGGDDLDELDAGDGDDRLYGDGGDDRMTGGLGSDVLGGGDGADRMDAGAGNDTMNGDAGADTMTAGSGNDVMSGGTGADSLDAGGGNDRLSGNEDDDRLFGGDGRDSLYGGEGNDVMAGGADADLFQLWETQQVRDTIQIRDGDSGLARDAIDRIEGFASGVDKIDLSRTAVVSFEDLDFRRDGQGSCYFDGHFLRIDTDGDARTDMIVEFAWVGELAAGDFLFA